MQHMESNSRWSSSILLKILLLRSLQSMTWHGKEMTERGSCEKVMADLAWHDYQMDKWPIVSLFLWHLVSPSSIRSFALSLLVIRAAVPDMWPGQLKTRETKNYLTKPPPEKSEIFSDSWSQDPTIFHSNTTISIWESWCGLAHLSKFWNPALNLL